MNTSRRTSNKSFIKQHSAVIVAVVMSWSITNSMYSKLHLEQMIVLDILRAIIDINS